MKINKNLQNVTLYNSLIKLNFNPDVINSIVYSQRRYFSQELQTNNIDKRRFLGLYLNYKFEIQPDMYIFLNLTKHNNFCLIDFEVDISYFEFYELYYDENISNLLHYGIDSIEELEEIFRKNNYDASLFKLYHSEYPLE